MTETTTPASAPPSSLPSALPEPHPGRWDWRPRLRWFAAEIAVVVAGVLIALALNAWWGARQQAQEERRLLVALHDEFEANQDRLAQILAFHADLKATATSLLAASTDPSRVLPADSVDQWLADVTWWSSYTTLESTVLDAAVQDGQLALIETDSLRRLLSRWRSEVASASAQSSQEFEHYSGTWLPMLRAEADLARISNAATTIPGSATPYQADSMPVYLERTDHLPLIRSRVFRNALVQKVWIEEDVLYQYETLRPLLLDLLAALEREVGEGRGAHP